MDNPDAAKKWKVLIVAALALGIATIPVWLVSIPPTADFPKHLARLHILLNVGHDPLLAQYYKAAWGLIPNMAFDIFVFGTARVFGLLLAGKLFIILLFAVMLTGPVFLHYALFQRWSYWPLGACLLLYSRHFLWGMVSYTFGAGLSLWAIGLWIYLRQSRTAVRLVVPAFMAVALYFSHLFAVGFYAVVITTYELFQLFGNERCGPRRIVRLALILGAQFVLPFVFFLNSPTASHAGRVAFGDFSRKFIDIPMGLVNNYNLIFDAGTLALIGGFFLFGLYKGWLRIHRIFYGVFAVVVALHFAMPQYLMSSANADVRTILPLALLAVGTTRFTVKNHRMAISVFAAVACLFIVRTGIVACNWAWAERAVWPEYRDAIALLPRGAKLNSYFLNTSRGWFTNPPHAYFVTLAIIKKSAWCPRLSHQRAQWTVAFRSPYEEIARRYPALEIHRPDPAHPLVPDAGNPRNPFYIGALARYDYLLVANPSDLGGPVPPCLDPRYQGRFLTLYQIDHAQTGGAPPPAG